MVASIIRANEAASAMQTIEVQHFVRRLRDMLLKQDGQFAFFLGAGCSISSEILGAKALVEQWLPGLYTQMTGRQGSLDAEWLSKEFPKYDPSDPAASYATVMRRLFLLPVERQREIERVVGGRDPGFGYAVLAKLITHEKCGRNCNLVLTTNFDDMVADALYLYTQQKPLVIIHDSLVSFVETGRVRPLVIKLHGDALLEPKNTDDETRALDPKVRDVLADQLAKRGLIFIGYGGNDTSVTSFLKEQPVDSLTWGVYWVHDTIPENEFGRWLQSRPSAVWVKHLRFDELMVLVYAEFGLTHPEEARFGRLMKTYRETFEKLTKGVAERPTSAEKKALSTAVEKAAGEAESWWSFFLKALALEKSDPDKANEIYREGVEKFEKSAELLGSYARFLYETRKDFDQAETFYRRALDVDPSNATNLGNYANFLWQVRKDFDQAETFYRRALDANPTNAINLGNFATFLWAVRRDFDQAEAFYRRAIDADPNDAAYLGNYANFLYQVRKDFDQAEAFYRRALDADPSHGNNLANFAGFLLAAGERNRGLELLQRVLKAAEAMSDASRAECQYYLYANGPSEGRPKALSAVRLFLQEGIRSPGWDLSRNVARAEQDGHPNVPLLKVLAAVIADQTPIETLDQLEEWRNAATQ